MSRASTARRKAQRNWAAGRVPYCMTYKHVGHQTGFDAMHVPHTAALDVAITARRARIRLSLLKSAP